MNAHRGEHATVPGESLCRGAWDAGGAGDACPHISVRHGRRVLSVGETPTRQLSFQPVAIGTFVEATKRPKLPV